jgi:hypothetical protein
MEVSGRSASRPGRSTPREGAPGIHWIGGWVGHSRSGRGAEEKISSPRRKSNPRTPIVQPVARKSCTHLGNVYNKGKGHHRVQNGSGVHPACCPMGTRSSFPGCKAAGAWSYTSTPQYVFMAWCLVKHRDNFIFTFMSISRKQGVVKFFPKLFTSSGT